MPGQIISKRTLATVAALSAVATAAMPAVAPAKAKRPAPRPDLVVQSGNASRLNNQIVGGFVVKNTGSADAGATSAALIAKAGRKSYRVKSFRVGSLKAGKKELQNLAVVVPARVPAGTFTLELCVDRQGTVKERSESNNCRRLGGLKVVAETTPTPEPTPTPIPAPTPTPTPTPAPGPADSKPANPISFTKETPFKLTTSQSDYWIKVPSSYDASHKTPTTLFVWMHGCGGESRWDLDTVTPGNDRSYIAISLGGRDGGCWDVNNDPAKVLAAVADVKSHFNVNPRRVILGGYSSGGDLAYRTGFYNASLFAGILAENTAPFRDTGSTQQASIAAAAWKLNVLHLAHRQDDTYDIGTVRSEVSALKAAGFPATLIERDGNHYDDSTATTGTDHDLQTLLLPHIDDGWLAP